MKLVNWNLEWANPDYPRGKELKRRLLEQAPDVAVLTETVADFLAGAGHTIAHRRSPTAPSPVTPKDRSYVACPITSASASSCRSLPRSCPVGTIASSPGLQPGVGASSIHPPLDRRQNLPLPLLRLRRHLPRRLKLLGDEFLVVEAGDIDLHVEHRPA